MNVFVVESYVSLVIVLALLAVKGFAFVNALSWPAEYYSAAGKLTKPAWGAILGLGLAAQILLIGSPMSLIHIVFTVAALVYLADVRPALAALTRR